jgi:rhodanese-related sulfurtransferase
MRKAVPILIILVAALAAGCRTLGVSREAGGYAAISPPVAHDMMLDTRQLIVIDFRPEADFYGPDGHIGGAINIPFATIEHKLPEMIPYQSATVLVYGEYQEDGARGARVLVAAGFRNIVVIDGGIRAWIERGFRTVQAK